jgi:predicted ABC-type transport system involved in lysophospholipase L1 biosynthesis ATPase subunit
VTTTPVLQLDSLAVRYPTHGFRKPPTTVIEDVSFEVGQAETVALVGESGSGKTTIGRAVLGLTPVSGGRVLLDGRDITRLAGRARRLLSSDLQAIFQNPYGSLNPALPVGRTLAEPLLSGSTRSRQEVREHIGDLLRRVGLPEDAADRYPAQFSGGQRHRPGGRQATQAHHLRRTDQRPRRHHPGRRAESPRRTPAHAGVRLSVHHSRPRRRQGVRGTHPRTATRTHRRGGPQHRRVRPAAARLHPAPGGCRARPRSNTATQPASAAVGGERGHMTGAGSTSLRGGPTVPHSIRRSDLRAVRALARPGCSARRRARVRAWTACPMPALRLVPDRPRSAVPRCSW